MFNSGLTTSFLISAIRKKNENKKAWLWNLQLPSKQQHVPQKLSVRGHGKTAPDPPGFPVLRKSSTDLNCPVSFQSALQDSELSQPPGDEHSTKKSPQENSVARAGGQHVSDHLPAAVQPDGSESPLTAGPAR